CGATVWPEPAPWAGLIPQRLAVAILNLLIANRPPPRGRDKKSSRRIQSRRTVRRPCRTRRHRGSSQARRRKAGKTILRIPKTSPENRGRGAQKAVSKKRARLLHPGRLGTIRA